MTPVSEKERRYLKKWESVRLKKWRYIIVNGILWSLPVGLLGYCWKIDFALSAMNIADAAIYLVVFFLGGLLYQYWLFRGQEKRYQEVRSEID